MSKVSHPLVMRLLKRPQETQGKKCARDQLANLSVPREDPGASVSRALDFAWGKCKRARPRSCESTGCSRARAWRNLDAVGVQERPGQSRGVDWSVAGEKEWGPHIETLPPGHYRSCTYYLTCEMVYGLHF